MRIVRQIRPKRKRRITLGRQRRQQRRQQRQTPLTALLWPPFCAALLLH